MSTIESVMQEHRLFEPAPEWVAQAHLAKADYDELCAQAAADYPGYWARLARDNLVWHKPFTEVLDESNAPFYKWFADGELNASYNCLDRHLGTIPNRPAVIFEADDGTVTKVTYKQLYHRVCQLANGLKSLGIKTGDRVLVYLPMSIEAIVAMQACARIGAIHSVVFGGFSAKSINERIVDAGAEAGHHRRRPVPRRQGDRAQARRRRGAGLGRLREHQGGRRLPPHRREGRLGREARHVVARPRLGPADRVRADLGRRRAPAVHPLHLRLDRQAQGRPALDRRLPAAGAVLDEVDVRHQGLRHLLVHRRRGLDHRPQLRVLRAAGGRRDRAHLRGRADVPAAVALLGDDRPPQRDRLLHGAHGDPVADQARLRPAQAVRPVVAAPARHRRRADQPRGVDVVLHGRRRLALPDRRHLVADRDRRAHDLADARGDGAEARLLHLPAARHPGRDRRRDRPRRRARQGRLPRHQAPVAGDDPHHLERPRALQDVVLPGRPRRQALPRRRRCEPRPRRLLLDHGPHRRRAQRLRPPPRHDGDRVGAGRQPARRRGGGRRPARTT